MFNPVNNETYIELTGSVFFSELERLEAETVTLIVVVRVEYHIDRRFYSLYYVTLAGSVCTIDGNRFQQSFIPDCKCIVGEGTRLLCLDVGSLQIQSYLLVYREKVGESYFQYHFKRCIWNYFANITL